MVNKEGAALNTRGTIVRGNHLTGNRIGVTIRRLRRMTVEGNSVSGNCGGVFVVSDESRPRAGALSIRGNDVSRNNKYCRPNARLPFIQGTGILLTGAEETWVAGNRVRGNVGKSPMSGGIVLYPSVVGAINARNTIFRNEVMGNKPADIIDKDRGPGNRVRGNHCDHSVPEGWCCKQ
ncbi:right-handed parallel beta-helix repeat-containing protein [Streptomyces sp. XD-27]|uniref:right-handed parallel beta-helix repeat-containing protein n=1 Tax=Streptomyces sp. XD-27 TaxID=3062779 RepID=UPI00350E4E09